MKNWKSLFVKTEEKESSKKEDRSESFSFPVNQGNSSQQASSPQPSYNDPITSEVLQVYENGLESINMPGYDFYEFYKTVSSAGVPGEQTYIMAFQMARTLDKTISSVKLLSDAE